MSKRAPLSSLHRRLISGSVWTILGKIVIATTGLAINAIIARIVSPDEVGAYFLIVSVLMLSAPIALLGQHVAVVRLIAEAMAIGLPGKARAIVNMAFRLGALGILAVLLFVGLGGELLAKHIFASDSMARVMWLAGLWVAVVAAMNLSAESFRGFHDYGLATLIGGVISNIITVTLLFGIFLWYQKSDLYIVLIVSIFGSSVSVFIAANFLRKKLAQLGESAKVKAGEVLRVALPLMLTGLAIFVLTQADLWVIAIFGTHEQVATFGAAVRVGQLIFIPLLINNMVLPPIISEMYSQGKVKELEKIIRAMSTISAIPAVVILTAFIFSADSILVFIYGDYYRAAAVPLVLLSLGQLVNVLSGSGMITLMMTGHQRSAMNISIIFGIFIIIGSTLVIRPYGVSGVAAVTGSAISVLACFTLFWTRYQTGMWTHVGLGSVPAVIKKLRSSIW
jgi:O-antigen/teichoic acid export membrane protein